MRPSEAKGRFSRASLGQWACGLLLLGVSAAGWAGVDPWEGANRKVYAVNDAADRAVLKPLARGYKWLFPRFIRRGIHNVFRNIGTPSVAVNQLLQGKPRSAASDTTRFVVNTTLGLGGLFDVATSVGLAEHEEDFGQTLSVWGAGRGPFLMIPLRGPSTTTDAVGMVVEALANPFRLISPPRDRYITYGVYFIDVRAELLSAEKLVTGDEYLFLRDAYLQRRDYLIHDGKVEEDPFVDDFDEDEYEE